MRIEKLYSHLNGHEWLLVHQKKTWNEIEEVLAKVDATIDGEVQVNFSGDTDTNGNLLSDKEIDVSREIQLWWADSSTSVRT